MPALRHRFVVPQARVKWALGSITTNKANGGDGIPIWVISNPKRWCCESAALNMPANLENSAVATGLEKVSFHSNAKECSNHHTIALTSHASKVMLKILQIRLQQYMNRELPDIQVGLEKAEEPEIELPTSIGSLKKPESSRKTYLLLLYSLCQSLWLCGSQQTVENSSRDVNTRPPELPPEKSVCMSRSNS